MSHGHTVTNVFIHLKEVMRREVIRSYGCMISVLLKQFGAEGLNRVVIFIYCLGTHISWQGMT